MTRLLLLFRLFLVVESLNKHFLPKFAQVNDYTNIQILTTKIKVNEVEQFVADSSCGGVVSFVGIVRDSTDSKPVLQLDFESYEPMAIREMKKIAETVLEEFSVKKIAIHHRVGSLKIGEIAVAIAVSCPHRKDAFAACEYAIDTLKQTVPIWKKEIFQDGEVWVSAHP